MDSVYKAAKKDVAKGLRSLKKGWDDLPSSHYLKFKYKDAGKAADEAKRKRKADK